MYTFHARIEEILIQEKICNTYMGALARTSTNECKMHKIFKSRNM
jgi:hypothetical protein